MSMENEVMELSNEELSQVSGGGGAYVIAEYDYDSYYYPHIRFCVMSDGTYIMKNTLTAEERIVENARDFDEVARELLR